MSTSDAVMTKISSIKRPQSLGAEIEALIEAADKTTRSGRRDRMLLMLALQTEFNI